MLVAATKTSNAFIPPGFFMAPNNKGIKSRFWLPRRVEHPYIMRVYANSPQENSHHMRVKSLDDLDNQLQNWLGEAYAVGM